MKQFSEIFHTYTFNPLEPIIILRFYRNFDKYVNYVM